MQLRLPSRLLQLLLLLLLLLWRPYRRFVFSVLLSQSRPWEEGVAGACRGEVSGSWLHPVSGMRPGRPACR